MPSKNWAIPWRRTIEAELSNLAAIRRFHKAAKTGLGVADPAMLKIRRAAVAEAAANVILHGYNGQGGPLDIKVKHERPDLLILLCDQAPPFDPTGIPPPDITQPLTERRMGHRAEIHPAGHR